MRVHLAGEHALELEARDRGLDLADVRLHGAHHALVGVRLGEFEQLGGFVEPGLQLVEGADDRLELGALTAEFLGAVGLAPDGRILEFPQHLGQALAAALVVKGTP